MRLILALLVLAFLAGCSGMQVNWDIDKQAAGGTAACEAGYQMAKHLPNEAVVAYKYAKAALETAEPIDFNNQFKIWKDYTLEKAGLNRHYRRQLDKFMPNITLPEGELPTGEWMEKAKPYLLEFTYGIEDGLDELDIPYELSEISAFQYFTADVVPYPVLITDDKSLVFIR